jgi:hypothetical protein
MDLSLNDSITIPDTVLFRELDGEAVLLNLKTGTYFGLNPVATRIWQLIAEQHSLARVLQTMADEYDVDRDLLHKDLMELVEQLCAKGLGEIASA